MKKPNLSRFASSRESFLELVGDRGRLRDAYRQLLTRELSPAERRLVAVAQIRSTDRTRSVAVIAVIAYAAGIVDVEIATDLAIEAEAFQSWLVKQNWRRHCVKSEPVMACTWLTAEILRRGLIRRGVQTDRFSAAHHRFWTALALRPLTKNALRKKRRERADPLFQRFQLDTASSPILGPVPPATLSLEDVLKRARKKLRTEHPVSKAA